MRRFGFYRRYLLRQAEATRDYIGYSRAVRHGWAWKHSDCPDFKTALRSLPFLARREVFSWRYLRKLEREHLRLVDGLVIKGFRDYARRNGR